MKTPLKIVLIGAGNVASQIGPAFQKSGSTILQVYSRSKSSASKLAKKLKSEFTTDLKAIKSNADLYILAIKDDALHAVIQQLTFNPKLIVHTSGTKEIQLFKDKFSNYGVLYPLQTFSNQKKINFSEIPIFIEANNASATKQIEAFAKLLSPRIYKLNSEKRKALHVAAVFACNFSNHMYAIADEILKTEKIPFEVLLPLIEETARKVKNANPKSMQTGPAVRKDKEVINAHKIYLKNQNGFKKIYTLVSQSISDFTKNNGAE